MTTCSPVTPCGYLPFKDLITQIENRLHKHHGYPFTLQWHDEADEVIIRIGKGNNATEYVIPKQELTALRMYELYDVLDLFVQKQRDKVAGHFLLFDSEVIRACNKLAEAIRESKAGST